MQMYAEGKEPEAVLRSIMSVASRVETLVGIVLDAAEQQPEGVNARPLPPSSIPA